MTFLSIDANNKLYEAKLNAENNNRNVSEINKTISDNSIFATNSLQYDLSVDNTNSINQNLFIPDDEIVDSFEYQTSDINANARELYDELEQTREDQGIIGKLWDGFKNLTGFGAGSNKAEDAIKQYENGEISLEEAKEKLNGYQQGQETCVDVVGDIVSGIVAVGAFALAVPTGGTSLIAGLGLAAAAGAGSKIAVKAGDAIIGGREYSGKDLLYDSATGAVNGLFAPVTNGVGACVTKTVGKKLGLTVVKEGTKEAIEQGAKQGLKSIITQQGVDVIGGTFAKRALATASGMAIDGAIGGSTDNMIRAALDGEDAKGIFEAGVQGLAGGLIMSPVIGGGFKVAGKLGKNLNNKITTKALFKDGMNTTFKQGQTGDCALLSFLSGAMNNRETQDTIKKSITKSIGGDYHIRIGNQTIDIPKSALTDEMLSDTTGIKLFEAAYKKAGGSIDGEFADNVAKYFGFSPVHITSDTITDETLDKIAKEQGAILSLGAKVDSDGNIAKEGANHYFSIKNVDANKKTLTLSDPYDTSKTIELSYDDAKKFGISIDGGTKGETNLPNALRSADDISFAGKTEELSETIEQYYQGKINSAIKHSDIQGQQILCNWKDEYGIPDADGKYMAAVRELLKDGGAADMFLDEAFPKLDKTTRNNAKKVLGEYLENNLDIYSYDRIRAILSDFGEQIEKIDNPVFYIPKKGKSYDIIATLYKETNSNAHFVTGKEMLQEYCAVNPGANIIIMDDCLASGNSAIDVYNEIKGIDGLNDINLFTLLATKDGAQKVAQDAPGLNLYYNGELKAPLKETDFYESLGIKIGKKINHVQQDFLTTLLGGAASSQNQYSLGNYAIMFQYMAPNNNSIFASNMIQHLYSGPRVAIKNSGKVIGVQTPNLVYPPVWLEKAMNNIK